MNVIVPKTAAELALGLSLPHRKMEDWRWTDLRQLIDRSYGAAPAKVDAASIERLIARSPLANIAVQRIVFVNGKLDKGRSCLDGVSIGKNAIAPVHKDFLLELNEKLKPESMTLVLEGTVDTPVEVLQLSFGQQAAVASRLHVEVAKSSSATLVETYLGDGDYINNPVVTVTVHKGARLDRLKLELEAERAQHLSHTIFWLGADSRLFDLTLTTGSVLSRQNVNVTMLGQGGTSQINGAYLLRRKQHADTRLVVDHAVPHCTSRELFKCVMDDHARGIFQGKVMVRKDAQKTDGKQSSHALLLSETAEFDAKPELEIFADDVVCGHGATSGDLNHDHLFYLMSRGIPEAEAKSLLIAAFVGEAFDVVAHEGIKEALVKFSRKWLTERRRAG